MGRLANLAGRRSASACSHARISERVKHDSDVHVRHRHMSFGLKNVEASSKANNTPA